MKAIIVDDSVMIRLIIKKFLLTQGFDTILEGKDGRDALAKLEEGASPDLAVVDWNMPVMNGLEFVQAVRAIPSLDGMRIIMVTTEAASMAALALEAGANGYVTKPFTAEKLGADLVRLGITSAA